MSPTEKPSPSPCHVCASSTAGPPTTWWAPNPAAAPESEPNAEALCPTVLDSCVARRQKKRALFGLPKGIVLLATPDGWRHAVTTVEGGMLCGRLSDELLDPEVALAAATAMLKELTRDFHDTTIEVIWDPRQEPWTWTAQVIAIPHDETAPTDSRS